MKKISVIGAIKSYDIESGEFIGHIQNTDRWLFQAMFEFVGPHAWKMAFGKYYKGRTTGKYSQNHHYWGHLQQIASASGNDIDQLDDLIRYRAISMGYPFDIIDGWKLPKSERLVTTKEYAILIEMTHWFASDEGIVLYEGEEENEEEV